MQNTGKKRLVKWKKNVNNTNNTNNTNRSSTYRPFKQIKQKNTSFNKARPSSRPIRKFTNDTKITQKEREKRRLFNLELKDYKQKNRHFSALQKLHDSGQEVFVHTIENQIVSGQIEKVDKYEIIVNSEGEEKKIHKLQILYVYPKDTKLTIKSEGKINKELKAKRFVPSKEPKNRLCKLSMKSLLNYKNKRILLNFEMLDGFFINGKIIDFGLYEIEAELKGEKNFVILRHGLHKVRMIKKRMPRPQNYHNRPPAN